MSGSDMTHDRIPAFRREDFQTYLQTLRSACTAGLGSVVLTALKDPISAHIADPFVKIQVDALGAPEKRRFRQHFPADYSNQVLHQPNKVMQSLPKLVELKVFSYEKPDDNSEVSAHTFRQDYLTLKATCEKWIQSESNIYRVCVESLRKSDMLDEVCTEAISKHFAGRLLLSKIEEAGANYSDKAASELTLQMVSNSMLAGETVSKYYARHTGILKNLRRRGLSADEILALIEKTVFVRGLPDSQFSRMKDVIAFNKTITLLEIVDEAKDVENLDGKRFAAEHSGTMTGRVNAVVGNHFVKSKKACWKVLLSGQCDNANCQFSHDRNTIM